MSKAEPQTEVEAKLARSTIIERDPGTTTGNQTVKHKKIKQASTLSSSGLNVSLGGMWQQKQTYGWKN